MEQEPKEVAIECDHKETETVLERTYINTRCKKCQHLVHSKPIKCISVIL